MRMHFRRQMQSGKTAKKWLKIQTTSKSIDITANFIPCWQFFLSQEFAGRGPKMTQWDWIDFRLLCFSYRYHWHPLSIICLQLRNGELAGLISLTGIIAVMMGFAENMNKHENKHVRSAGVGKKNKKCLLPQTSRYGSIKTKSNQFVILLSFIRYHFLWSFH